MKRIAYKEYFNFYVYVGFKVADNLLMELKKSGFKADKKETNTTDFEIIVKVTGETSTKAYNIIKNFT